MKYNITISEFEKAKKELEEYLEICTSYSFKLLEKDNQIKQQNELIRILQEKNSNSEFEKVKEKEHYIQELKELIEVLQTRNSKSEDRLREMNQIGKEAERVYSLYLRVNNGSCITYSELSKELFSIFQALHNIFVSTLYNKNVLEDDDHILYRTRKE